MFLFISMSYRVFENDRGSDGERCRAEWDSAQRVKGDVAPAMVVNSPHVALDSRLGRRIALTLPLLPPPQKN
jgi:hypothetical protein